MGQGKKNTARYITSYLRQVHFRALFQLNVDTPVDREGMRYHITDAIDCGNESYGILSSDRGLRFVDISLPLGENRCRLSSFMEYYLDDVDSDETQLHLFVY